MYNNVERRFENEKTNNKTKNTGNESEDAIVFHREQPYSNAEKEPTYTNQKKLDKIVVQSHRFIFSKEFTEKLKMFSSDHKNDHRKEFKKAWGEWISDSDIKPLIQKEIENINKGGFKGDIMDKMFTCVRYYYRKKKLSIKDGHPHQEIDKIKRKKNETLGAYILEKMDEHIILQIKQGTIYDNAVLSISASPSQSFEKYCIEYKEQILAQTNPTTITKEQLLTIINQFKKTYKNRFYIMKKSLQI